MLSDEVKICKSCGAAVPKDYRKLLCPTCKAKFQEGLCTICGQYTYNVKQNGGGSIICKTCASRIECERGYKAKKRERARAHTQSLFEVHIEKLPKNPKPLSEKEWQEACRYFNGCAICGNNSIAARMLFIPAKYGGRYTASNVVPVCSKCATEARASCNPNPYNRYCQIIRRGRDYFKIIEEKMPEVYAYIVEKLWEEEDYYG